MLRTGNSGPPLQSSKARFRLVDGLHLKMGPSQQLVYSPLTGEARMVDNATARLLQGCRTAASLDEHATVLVVLLGMEQAQIHAVRSQLDVLVAAGLLVAEQTLLERCVAGPAQSTATPRISSVGFGIGDRPIEPRMNIGSLAARLREQERSTRLLIADSSRTAESRRENEQVLTALRRRFGCDITYMGAEAKAAFAELLSKRAQVSPDILRFALLDDGPFPIATGRDYNALLLATVGELMVQVDGDADCTIIPSPESAPGVALTSVHDPTSFWPDDEQAQTQEHTVPVDLCEVHERLLGKQLASCLQECRPEDIDTDGMRMSFVRRLRDKPCNVVVTSLGAADNLGTTSEFALLCQDGAARDRFVLSPDGYRRALRSRRAVRGVRKVTIGDSAFCGGLNLGLDNRAPLPPAMPGPTNLGGIFAATVRLTGRGCFGYLPWTIHHRDRPLTDDVWRACVSVLSGDIIEGLVQSLEQAEGSGTMWSLPKLGSLLVELGTLPLEDFNELVQRILWLRALQRINLLEQLLIKHDRRPKSWASVIAEYLSALRAELTHSDYILPLDLVAASGRGGASILMQRLVLEYGRLLEAWPSLRDAALELRMRGDLFGQTV
jgi:hypothetical protein